MAGGPTTEVSSNVVDLTPFLLDELRSDEQQTRVKAAVEWALTYAGGSNATAVQVQDQ